MEESTESHMETDVSSTTEDVPEMQEVTGSDGNVEMIILVEKMEDEPSTDDQNKEQPSLIDGNTNDVAMPEDKSSVKETQMQSLAKAFVTSPTKSPNKDSKTSPIIDSTKSPTKDSTKSPFKNSLKFPIKDLTKSPIKDSTKSSNIDLSQSPVKDSTKSPIKDLPKPPIKDSITSPFKNLLKFPIKDLTKSPIKDSTKSSNIDLMQSPVKDPIKSPIKDLPKPPIKESTKSPIKDSAKLLIQDSTKFPIMESKFTILESTKSPIKDVSKSLIKSPSIDQTNSSTKEAEVANSLSEVERVIAETRPQLLNDVPPFIESQQIESADSSMDESLLIQIEDKKSSVQKYPRKEVQKTVQNSPIKELHAQDTVRSAPTKEVVLIDRVTVNGNVQCNDSSRTDERSKSVITTIDITIESSNDSQIEILSDISEKEHRNISRELKSLINSAKESKIISECTQLKSKTRKSRVGLETSSLNSSLVEPNKIHDTRRNSDISQKSSCSEKSDKAVLKRSMRSQNPEFVNKVKQFLNSVTGKGHKEPEEDEELVEVKSSKDKNDSKATPPKVKRTEIAIPEKWGKLRSDQYCWRCHWVVEQVTNEKMHAPMQCTVCPRTFHYKCLTSAERNKINLEKNWVCPECMIVLQAESSETRSPAMKKISLGMLCDLLRYALLRMTDLNGVEPFMNPVDRTSFPDYDKYVVHPMDLTLMGENISNGLYGSTEAFLADAQWILHNSIIFNTVQSKLTAAARALVRSCRAEMGEIEACPECYAAAHAHRPTWFTDVCSTPHILFWAKLKGFPYWPAKGMSVNSAGLVDVRFFGAHDRAWVPAKDCFLYSEKDPNNFRTKRQDIIDSMKEAEQHIRNISRKYGRFVYPPFKTQFDPSKMNEQLKLMIPTFEGEVRSLVKEKASPAPAKEKSRSNSKSSKSSFNDGDTSDNDETPIASRKMADGAEIAKMEEDDSTTDKDSMEVDNPLIKVTEDTQPSVSTSSSRKRRRSELEEAVITIIESSGRNLGEKRKKMEGDKTEKSKNTEPEPGSSNIDDKLKTDKLKEITNEGNKTNRDQTPPKSTETEAARSTEKEKQRVTPIRIALVTKEKHHVTRNSTSRDATAIIITPNKDKETEKTTPQRRKSVRNNNEKTPSTRTETVDSEKASSSKPEKVEKTSTPKPSKVDKTPSDKHTKERRSRSEKRSSRSSRSTNSSSSTRSSDKTEKRSEKRSESNSNKEKTKDTSNKDKQKETEAKKSRVEKQMSPCQYKPGTESNPKSVKDRLQFDDDTTLADLARESSTNIIINNTGLPTISCVRSLSTTAQNTSPSITKTTTIANTIDITDEATSSVDNARTMMDAVSKLQKLRSDAEPVVGRVGVCAFARMTSPERQNIHDDMQVEIKAEAIDLDDADRHMEKMDLMNAFRLRPVNPQNPPSTLRDVRINKVVVTPLNAVRKTAPKAIEIRPRAKKTFPQPKTPGSADGRSELNSKNSMVYIPIQPPMTQAPVRLPRPQHGVPPNVAMLRAPGPITSTANNLVNTVTTPLMQLSSSCSSSTTTTTSTSASVASVPTVHTVPLMTSVNGQWMFSFQPVMSVGAIDNTASQPIMNGVTERVSQPLSLTSLNPTASTVAPTAAPAPPIAVVSRAPVETTPGEPPRLQQRPSVFVNPLDASAPIGTMPVPSTAGPVTAKLNQSAVKMTDFFRALLEDSLEKLDEPASHLTSLRLQLEQALWRHQQEIKEVKHNHELTITEMRASFEKEKLRAVSEARRAAQFELEAAIKQTKAKQWCANCSQEAQFYCCWNTSYCDYPCQRAHWTQHHAVCQQRSQDDTNGEPPKSPENRLQPQPDMPKNTSAPTLTVGGKVVAPARVYSQDTNSTQKTSIIVSMMEDTSGNQTMKCVGTYKPSPPTQIQPIIINKQIMNSEENSNKKVVSSTAGYLIVGASNNSSVMTPSRRTHTIQYYT